MNASIVKYPDFHSILFPDPSREIQGESFDEPDFFRDLNLDQIVQAITLKWEGYDLKPLFYVRPTGLTEISYRQDVMKELESEDVLKVIREFSLCMRTTRARLKKAEKLYYKLEKDRWFIGAANIYCDAVEKLGEGLRDLNISSEGLSSLSRYMNEYLNSNAFKEVASDCRNIASDMASIRFSLLLSNSNVISGTSVTVFDDKSEIDYSDSVNETFGKFRLSSSKDYRTEFRQRSGLDNVDAQILDGVSKLHPEVFQNLESFCSRYQSFQDAVVSRFDLEIQFYLATLAFIQPLRDAQLSFCYPRLSSTDKQVNGNAVFDLALADLLVGKKMPVVCNNFDLHDPERILVISGPNQGGKTTFARTFGQLHYLGQLGCPVPGKQVRLFFCDHIFVHFERQESIANHRGKLQDDLVRVHRIMSELTPNSLVVMNEIFSSTTLDDAVYLSRKVLTRISELDAIAVCVTFLTELADFNEKTVSFVSTIDPGDPAVRTFKVQRKDADGLSYAMAIAEKYRVTYDLLKERIKP